MRGVISFSVVLVTLFVSIHAAPLDLRSDAATVVYYDQVDGLADVKRSIAFEGKSYVSGRVLKRLRDEPDENENEPPEPEENEDDPVLPNRPPSSDPPASSAPPTGPPAGIFLPPFLNLPFGKV